MPKDGISDNDWVCSSEYCRIWINIDSVDREKKGSSSENSYSNSEWKKYYPPWFFFLFWSLVCKIEKYKYCNKYCIEKKWKSKKVRSIRSVKIDLIIDNTHMLYEESWEIQYMKNNCKNVSCNNYPYLFSSELSEHEQCRMKNQDREIRDSEIGCSPPEKCSIRISRKRYHSEAVP